jgi:hypothetical protein
MKKLIIILFVFALLLAIGTVLNIFFELHPFVYAGIIFVLAMTFTPLKNPKPTPKVHYDIWPLNLWNED